MRTLHRLGLWPLIAALSLLGLVLFVLVYLQQPTPNRNALAVGERATTEYLDLALQPLTELDFKQKEDVLSMRAAAVGQYPHLVARSYRPSDTVFGQIVDGLPWWGILGAYHYGSGERSIEGLSEQSLSILNPYLLAVPELYMHWETPRQGYSRYCAPHRLRWYPSHSYADVTYRAACLRENGVGYFSIIAYNARDWNLDYIFVSYANSRNVVKSDPPIAPYKNPQYLHQGGSCGYPGGCNNISPHTPAIDNIQITGWPAGIVLWFWQQEPGSADETPDVTFVIRFE